jgi:hypothetical protein
MDTLSEFDPIPFNRLTDADLTPRQRGVVCARRVAIRGEQALAATSFVLARADDSIGSYEVDLDFDGDVLDVASIDFSGNFGVSRTGSTLNTGSVNATETTLELPSTLERIQPDDVFSLFTVEFTAAAVGETVLGGRFQAVDPFGRVVDGLFSDDELPGGRLADARVEVTADDEPTSVPAPSSIWLLAVGLMVGLVRQRDLTR